MDEDDARNLEALLVAHRDELIAFVRRRARSEANAEDIVQQVAVRALASRGGLRGVTSGRAWLFRITRRLVTDYFRNGRAKTEERAQPDGGALEQEFGCACVIANLRRLPDHHARILQRVVVDGAGTADVALELGLTLNAATVRLHRARAALRQRLLAHCGTKSLRECLDCSCMERRCCEAQPSTSPL